MDNEEKIELNEESKEKKEETINKKSFKNILKYFTKVPKFIKHFIIIGLALLIASRVNYSMNTKTTKFGLQDVGELVAQTAYLTIVEDTKVNYDFFELFDIPFTESRQIFSYDVEVDASVDFSKISYDINDTTKEINVKIPHSRIYKTTLDVDSLVIYLDESSIFSRIDLSKQNNALISMKKQVELDAIENGILEEADTNAKKLIEGMIKSNRKYKKYYISYQYKDL